MKYVAYDDNDVGDVDLDPGCECAMDDRLRPPFLIALLLFDITGEGDIPIIFPSELFLGRAKNKIYHVKI